MSRHLTHFTGCLLSMTLASGTAMTATAETSGNFEKQWYLGAGLGLSTLKPDTDSTGFSLDDKNDTGYKLFAGYDFTERFSLEGYFSRLGQAELSPNGTVKYQGFGISALYYLYKSRQPHVGWSLFGRGGIGRMKNTANIPYERDNNHHIMFGAGVEYGFNNGFALRLDADFYDADAQLIAINVLKRFGHKKKPVRPPVTIMDSDSDNDNDGVIDNQDRCPKTVAGSQVDAQGCIIVFDSDSDGVADDSDKCPNSPAGTKVDSLGCEPDDDADGIANSQDNCPETPTETAVDANGCELQTTIILKGVTFATASAELIGDSRRELTEVVDTLRRHPELKLEIAGHTDNRGEHDYNVRLSQQRADSVRNYLIVQGIAEKRLKAKGYGPSEPLFDNVSEDGRATNRRVELHIIK